MPCLAAKLYPRFDVSTLPVHAGGIGAPHLLHSFAAMRSKSVCQAFRHQQHPWTTLFLHEVGLFFLNMLEGLKLCHFTYKVFFLILPYSWHL